MLLRFWLSLFAIAYILPATTSAQEIGELTIGVMDFKGVGLPQEQADMIADIIAMHISELGDVRVVSRADINSMLNLEKQKRLTGCTDKECFSEIAGALGMPWMVTGNLSIFGESVMLNLKLIDVRNAFVAGRSTLRVRGEIDDILDELGDVTEELFENVAHQLGISVGVKTVTSSSRHRQPVEESPSAISVITREEIETSGANTFTDLLRVVPGMEVILLGINTGTPAGRLHYTDGNYHFLVLIDGREANIEVLGQTLWESLPISIEDVERIEVIRGPASVLYGANALSGVISITTRAITEKNSGWAMITGGEVGLTRLGLRSSNRLGNWGISVGGIMDFLGTFTDLHASSMKLGKLRALAEYCWSEPDRILIDGTAVLGTGPRNTPMGNLNNDYTQASLRLAYEGESLRGRLYWFYLALNADMEAALEFGGIRLADVKPALIKNHTIDGEVQWTPPRFWDPLLLIAGGGGRISWVGSDDLLDGETYIDITSPRYHQPGLSHWEMRGSAFVHAELAAADWVTLTSGIRLDYNTDTGVFLSPRLAAVFQLASGQFARISGAQSFRKPSFLEKGIHLDVTFPDDSPVIGGDREIFREFMTSVIGNSAIENEELTAFEMGYLGKFFDEELSIALDLYCNLYRNRSLVEAHVFPGAQGLPDMRNSSYRYEQSGDDINVFGSELTVRFRPLESLSFLAVWTHKEIFYLKTKSWSIQDPRNFITLGGRFRTKLGLLGSFYVFTRSEFLDTTVFNPAGLLEESLQMHVDSSMLLLGKLGWRWSTREGITLEGGIKIFQPVSPFGSPHFQSRDKGGGMTPDGRTYGAILLGRILSGYLQGSF